MKRAFHGNIRALRRSPDGRAQFGLGARLGYWPCLYAPYVQVMVLQWRVELWHGLPSYKETSCTLDRSVTPD